MTGSARRQLFISHNHRDDVWLERIHVHLKPHLRAHKLTVWDDTQIPPGAQRQETLTAALGLARAAILLVSPDYLASDLIAEQELPPLLTAAEQEGLLILWLPVRPSSYKHTPIGRYQALYDPEHPLSKLSPAEMDDAWFESPNSWVPGSLRLPLALSGRYSVTIRETPRRNTLA